MSSPPPYGQPSTPPTGTPRPKAKSSGSMLAIGLAGLAIVLALVSAGLSWRASTKAGNALDQIAALASAPPATPTSDLATQPTPDGATPSDAGPTESTPTPTGSDPELTKETQFGDKYTGETLRLPASCGNGINVDVDEPRVRVEVGVSEFYFYDPCGPKTPYFVLRPGVRGSVTDSDTVTPSDCVELIRRSPLPTGEQPIRQGQVYCINTSSEAAAESADSWKMVILKITDISQDGAVALDASAWNIP